LILPLVNVKSSGRQTYIVVSGRDEIVAVRKRAILRPRVSGVAHVARLFLMAHRKCDDSGFAYELNGIAMIFPFRVLV
jgi:hypothetical protein